MTTKPSSPPSPRPRALQDDLLADLRQAAPMPVGRPEPAHPASAPAQPSSAPAQPSETTDPQTPVVDVRVTPFRWSAPSLRPGGAGRGLVLTAGPVRISTTGRGR
ncbi:hypothetical protein [Geodermatophilus sp. CPCC 205506]|uniref:hypothetical protein n=1 Tax=Geodermatophilus sp. CPCC 205506 TaxID=2936596 RepID=UPI003EEE6DCB